MSVRVKRLEWFEIEQARSTEDPTTEPTGDYEAADGLGMFYYIRCYFGSDSYGWEVTHAENFVSDHDDPEAAKASAYEHHQRNVLSRLDALEPQQEEAVAWVGDYLKSDGTYDYFVMIGKGERAMSVHSHKIRGRAEYEAAEINHALTGSAKPEFEDFDLDAPSHPTPVQQEEAVARPMAEAPKDGSMLRLFCRFDGDSSTGAFEDTDEGWTIGTNNLSNTGEDLWEIVGWDWEQDTFRQAHTAQPVGWLPFHPITTPVQKVQESQTAARFDRLHGICRRILWTDASTPAFENAETKAALNELAEFLFMDGVDTALAGRK